MLERSKTAANPPLAATNPVAHSWHGSTLVDEFAWLKAANWQDVLRDVSKLDPAIRAYLEAENAYAEFALGETKALQEQLLAELKGRIKQDDWTVPRSDGKFAYFSRYRQNGQHPLICRSPTDSGTEQMLLDGDALALGRGFFQLQATRHSPDHRLLAWTADDTGAEYCTVRIRNLEAGQDLADSITEVAGSPVVWSADASAFYYVRLDNNHRASKVFRHRLGTDSGDDVLIFEEADPSYFVSISKLQSGRYAEISVFDHATSESWLLDLQDANAVPSRVSAREQGILYSIEHHPDFFGTSALLILTNADGCEDFKIAWAPLSNCARGEWRDVLGHRPGIYLISTTLFSDWLIRLEREDGLPRIVVRHLARGDEHAIAFSEEAYSLGVERGYEFGTDTLRFSYSSMTTPNEVWDYNLVTTERVLRKRQEIPSGHDPSAYVTRRLHAPAPGGDAVPISILHRKDLPQDGSAPCMLVGYGAYGLSVPPSFNGSMLSLVDRGFVYALAHVRGGTDKGWRWYREGKLAKKTNTFTDFIAAAEHLIHEHWTHAGGIVARGGSAGGLLMGAVANMRPDLFGAIIAEVPFVDVLNTMLDETLPLTPPEWPEWGNPIADPEAFAIIRAYSPYENIISQDYPAILALSGLTDPRVLYWEPAKWVARLRQMKTDANVVALRTNMGAGHGGAPGRFDRLGEVALTYAFAIAAMDGTLAARATTSHERSRI